MFGDIAFAQAPFAALGGRTFASALSEAAAIDSSVSQESLLGGNILELAAGAAAVASINNILNAIKAESATATASPNFAASILSASQAESSVARGLPAFTASVLNAAQAETTVATDSLSATAALYAVIAEVVAVAGVANGGRGFSASIVESVAGASAQSIVVTFFADVNESAIGDDTLAVIKTLNVRPEGVQLYVYIGDVLVWQPINTDQTPPDPNWQVIPT